MKVHFVAACSLILAMSGLLLAGQAKSQDKDKTTGKPQVFESGSISKIDAKKRIITVHGVSFSFPGSTPGEPAGPLDGRRGRGGDGRDSEENTIRDMRVFVYADTLIQLGATTLQFEALKEGEQVTIIGASKGKSGDIDALSISVTEKQ